MCYTLAGIFSIIQLHKLLANDDVSSVSLRYFSSVPLIEYPTFTICFETMPLINDSQNAHSMYKSKGNTIFDEDLKKPPFVNPYNYQQAIMGNIKLDKAMASVNIEDVILGPQILFHNIQSVAPHTPESDIPMHLSYVDPKQICYTRNYNYSSSAVRKTDYLVLGDQLCNKIKHIRIYVHKPGRFIRTFDTEIVEVEYGSLAQFQVATKNAEGNGFCKAEKTYGHPIEVGTKMKPRLVFSISQVIKKN